MTDQTDPAPPATTPAKTPVQTWAIAERCHAIIWKMYVYAPSKLPAVAQLLESMMNANTEDSQ